MPNSNAKVVAAVASFLAVSLLFTGPADARRGGSFGSRGSRTYSAPQSTGTSPGYVGPMQRSMTRPAANAPYPQQYGAQQPGSRFGGFGGGLVGGLLAGGLIGGMMGHGFGGGWGGGGGGGGFLTILLQLAIFGGIGWFLLRMFQRRSSSAVDAPGAQGSLFAGAPRFGASDPYAAPPQTPVYNAGQGDQIGVTQSDRDEFQRLLGEVQDAFGHEDYSRLRDRTTPEVMSYLAEELSQNATQGHRNDVTGTRLIQSDISEAWSEGDADYVTAAFRYESIDVMRDRTTGAVLQGDPDHVTQTTELWTFVRKTGGPWVVSAIQETGAQ